MNIRKWYNKDIEVLFNSRIDKTIEEILSHIKAIFENLLNLKDIPSFKDAILAIQSSDKEELRGLGEWLKDEGETFFLKLSSTFVDGDAVLSEELNYLEFILSNYVEARIIYVDDLVGLIIDVSDGIKSLLFS